MAASLEFACAGRADAAGISRLSDLLDHRPVRNRKAARFEKLSLGLQTSNRNYPAEGNGGQGKAEVARRGIRLDCGGPKNLTRPVQGILWPAATGYIV
jgi:hypothetical protein